MKVYAHMTSIKSNKGNLGDKMGFHIIDWMFGRDLFKSLGIREKSLIDGNTIGVVGSLIAAVADTDITVVGGGLINPSARKYSESIKFEGVRGFLTKSMILRDSSISVPVIGDPGLLLSAIHKIPEKKNKKEIGFIIHHVDREKFSSLFPEFRESIVDNYEVLDVFVQQLSEYRLIVSTSLHGCIFCHAYGIPVAPFYLTDDVIGGDFKFQDYYSVYGYDLNGRLPLEKYKDNVTVLSSIIESFFQPTKKSVEILKEKQIDVISSVLKRITNADFKIKKLFIIETIFCDNENDSIRLDEYFKRFLLNLLSFKNLNITNDVSLKYLIYISSDKNKYISLINHEIKRLDLHFCEIVIYNHPVEGYNIQGDHIDLKYNPNKTAPRRDNLFRSSGFHEQALNYELVFRLAIDDDDVMPSWHVMNIIRFSERFLSSKTSGVYGFGFTNTFIDYIDDSGSVSSTVVKMNRSITGNKFWCFKNVHDISNFSPWMIPDNIDGFIAHMFKSKFGVDVQLVDNALPGVHYLRRSINLSNYQKKSFISKEFSKMKFENVESLIANKYYYSALAKDDTFLNKIDFRVTAFIDDTNNKIICSTNIKEIGKRSDRVAFYIYFGNEIIFKSGYSSSEKLLFEIPSDLAKDIEIKVKAFLRRDGVVITTAVTVFNSNFVKS